jgi:hypothetical protein
VGELERRAREAVGEARGERANVLEESRRGDHVAGRRGGDAGELVSAERGEVPEIAVAEELVDALGDQRGGARSDGPFAAVNTSGTKLSCW